MTCRGLADGRAGSLLRAICAVHPQPPQRAYRFPSPDTRVGLLLLLFEVCAGQGCLERGYVSVAVSYVRGEARPTRVARNLIPGNSHETLRERAIL